VRQVVIYDLADSRRRLTVASPRWRAMLQLLYRDSVLPKDRVGRLDWRLGGLGSSITRDECIRIWAYLEGRVLRSLAPGEALAVHDDPPAFDEVTDGTTFFRPPSVRTTRLSRNWLKEVADFLSTTDGVGALEEAFLPDGPDQVRRNRPTRA